MAENLLQHSKYRTVVDISPAIRDYYEKVARILPNEWIIPELDICDTDESPYGGLYTHSKFHPVIQITHGCSYMSIINHEMAHHICTQSRHDRFGSKNYIHHVVFACTNAILGMLMDRIYGIKQPTIDGIPDFNSAEWLTAYDVHEEPALALRALNGLSFVRHFYAAFESVSDDAFHLLNIDDICLTASHARSIYLGSLDISVVEDYPDNIQADHRKMKQAVQSALFQRLKKVMMDHGVHTESLGHDENSQKLAILRWINPMHNTSEDDTHDNDA